MAEDKNIAIEVEVKGVEKSVESMKDLKNAIKAAKDEQLKAASSFGEGSKQYTDAAKKVSALTDKVDDLKDSTASLAGSGLERAKSGFGQLKEGMQNLDFGKVKAGFTAMKSAIAAVGIGLIIQAVMYLVENFDELSKGSGVLAKSLRFVGDIITSITDAAYALTDALGLTTHALDAQREAMVANAEKAKEALGEQTKEYDRQMAVAKSNGESTVQIELQKQRAIQATNVMILSQLKAQIEAGQELDESQKKLLTSTLESVKNTHTAIQVIENTDRKDKAERDNKAYEDRKANNEKIQNANLSALQQLEDATIANENDAETRAILTAKKEKERRDTKIKDDITGQAYKDALLFQSELRLANELQAIADKSAADKKALDDKSAADKKALDDKAIADNKQMLDTKHAQQIAQDEKDGAEMVAKNEKRKADEKAVNDAMVNVTLQGLQAAQQLTDLFFAFKRRNMQKGSAEELAAAKKQFKINKALAITTATIQGVQGVLAAFSSGAAVPVVGAVLGPAYAVLAGVVAAANIAKIASAKFDEGGGGGGGGAVTSGGATPSVPIPSPPTLNTPGANTNSGTTFDSTGKNTSATTPTINVNATIGVDEINSKQNRVSVLEKQSTF